MVVGLAVVAHFAPDGPSFTVLYLALTRERPDRVITDRDNWFYAIGGIIDMDATLVPLIAMP
jgi:hypothetical protein